MEIKKVAPGLVIFLIIILTTWQKTTYCSSARSRHSPILPQRLLGYVEAPAPMKKLFMLTGSDGLIHMTIKTWKKLDVVQISQMEDAGIHFYYTKSSVTHHGLFYPVRCEENGVKNLEAFQLIEKVYLPPVQKPLLKLDSSRNQIGAEQSWYRFTANWPLTGRGIVIADIDSDVDISHPMLFRADGGYYEWVDVNGDGLFEPGTDAVDINGDGEICENELLLLIDAGSWRLYTWPPQQVDGLEYDGKFTAGYDWLYLDINGNGKRDFGYNPDDPDFPITEQTPAYGEPIFIVDDMNRNEKLDPGEKLIRLGSSKIMAILQGPGINIYIRGENLINYPGASAWEMSHATQTLSIVGGGVAGLTKYAGIAPEAELILAVYTHLDYDYCLSWVLEQNPDVVLHEVGSWVGLALDGSSSTEQIMDQSSAHQAVVHINPAGNLGGSKKHAIVNLTANQQRQLNISIPDFSSWGNPIHYGMMSFLWRSEGELKFEICNETDLCDEITVAPRGKYIWDGQLMMASWRETSERGTKVVTALFGDVVSGIQPLQPGNWLLVITNESSDEVKLHIYVADEVSGWGEGIALDETYVSDLYTVTYPGTADSCINVAAYAAHGRQDWGAPAPVGSYRTYSSKGPRIDEVAIMDVAGPDDPVTAAPPVLSQMGMKWGSYLEFGGTSGAGAHIAGGSGLILEAIAGLDSQSIRQLIRQSAVVDSFVGEVPNHMWGWGKFNVYKALFDSEPVEKHPPTLFLRAPTKLYVREPATIIPIVSNTDEPHDHLQIRWDIGYDGKWDSPFLPFAPLHQTFTKPQKVTIKAQVRDEHGMTGQDAVTFLVIERPEPRLPEDGFIEEADAISPTVNPEGGGCGCSQPII